MKIFNSLEIQSFFTQSNTIGLCYPWLDSAGKYLNSLSNSETRFFEQI